MGLSTVVPGASELGALGLPIFFAPDWTITPPNNTSNGKETAQSRAPVRATACWAPIALCARARAHSAMGAQHAVARTGARDCAVSFPLDVLLGGVMVQSGAKKIGKPRAPSSDAPGTTVERPTAPPAGNWETIRRRGRGPEVRSSRLPAASLPRAPAHPSPVASSPWWCRACALPIARCLRAAA